MSELDLETLNGAKREGWKIMLDTVACDLYWLETPTHQRTVMFSSISKVIDFLKERINRG